MRTVHADDVRVFYRPEYIYNVHEAGMRHTFDTQKPRRIYEALIADGLLSDCIAAPAVSHAQLALVHTPAYIADIHRPEVLAKLLLLDPEEGWGPDLIQPFLYASGGTIAAARMAYTERKIGINLGGGFHHAQVDKAEGFCAIADVAIAVRLLKGTDDVQRVLIVDTDYHHGNGNAEIFSTDESVFTFSVHATNWCWITKAHNRDTILPPGTGDREYLDTLQRNLTDILDTFRPDFVAYVAGSDPHEDDWLGDFNITEAGMLMRDQIVTRAVWGRGIPMIAVTAGGYGPYSWKLHYNYFKWLLQGAPA